jgi:hypothetical protein
LNLIIGDNFFFGAKPLANQQGVMRIFKINNANDFDIYIKEHKNLQDSIYKINYTYVSKQGVSSVFEIMPHFAKNSKVNLLLSSELSFEDFNSKNTLFIGKYSTLGILKELMNNKYFAIVQDSNKLKFFDKDKTIERRLISEYITKEDYSIVLRFQTSYKKNILLIISNDDPGVMATLNFMLQNKNEEWLEKKLGISENDCNFSALFKVNGLGRSYTSIDFVDGMKIRQ